MFKRCSSLLLFCGFSLLSLSISAKEVAITIDDLVYVGNTKGNVGKLRREKKRDRKSVV